MRKILLASTALVAIAGVSAASAEVSISGNTAFGYNSWSDDGTDAATSGANNNKFLSDTDIGASWSTTTDSGLSVSVSYDIDANESGATISGDWGNLSWSDGADAQEVGQGDGLAVTVVTTGTTTPDYAGEESIGGGTVAYSNSIAGIDFGVGLTNAGGSSLADESSWGVGYTAEVGGGATVTVGYASASTSADNTSDTTTGADETSLNGSIEIGNLTLGFARNTRKVEQNTADNSTDFIGYEDYNSNNFSVSYAISDVLSVSAESVAAKGDQGNSSGVGKATDYKYDRNTYGVDYTIATGVALTASYSDYTQSGTNSTAVSGTSTMVRVKVSF
ncbi:MAG: porin [Alphaproteobacteria bacterium]|nr:porin [Alphaproteobacteria bacterium]